MKSESHLTYGNRNLPEESSSSFGSTFKLLHFHYKDVCLVQSAGRSPYQRVQVSPHKIDSLGSQCGQVYETKTEKMNVLTSEIIIQHSHRNGLTGLASEQLN